MSVYVLFDYFEECKTKKVVPTIEGLNKAKGEWK